MTRFPGVVDLRISIFILCKPMLTATFLHSDTYYIRPRRVSSWTLELNLELRDPYFHTLRFSQYNLVSISVCLDREFPYYSISVSGSLPEPASKILVQV
jgi:hypothetical protein